MAAPEIRFAGPTDMALLNLALERLSDELGDYYAANAKSLAAACHGPHPGCHGFLAIENGAPVGAALASPVFSSTRGTLGVYVSDLWVATALRGQGLGRRLLREAASFGSRRWSADFLKLTVYANNVKARAFYEKLGFHPAQQDRILVLAGREFAEMSGAAP